MPDLEKKTPFVLWLDGEMGTGKTTLTRFILRELGLSEIIPVSSPTFAYLNEYDIEGKLYAHLDLFRADGHFDAEELGLTGERDFRGYFIEWPTQVAHDPFLRPTHKLKISYNYQKSEDMTCESGSKKTGVLAGDLSEEDISEDLKDRSYHFIELI